MLNALCLATSNNGKGRGGSSRGKVDHDTEVRLAKKLQELSTASSVTAIDLQKLSLIHI